MPDLFTLDQVTVTRWSHGAAQKDRRHTHPLLGVQASIRPGVCTVIVGPSGAGKTTLLRLLNRLEEPDSGAVSLHGRPLPSYDVLDLRRRVGLLQQQPVLLGRLVRDDVATARPELTEEELVHLLDRAGLGPEFLDRATDSLSGGEAQRVCLARALSVDPEVLLADEPTSALDAFAGSAVEKTLRALVDGGLTTVLVTHDLRQARRLADDLLVVIAGSVVASGPASEVFEAADPRVAEFLAGVS